MLERRRQLEKDKKTASGMEEVGRRKQPMRKERQRRRIVADEEEKAACKEAPVGSNGMEGNMMRDKAVGRGSRRRGLEI